MGHFRRASEPFQALHGPVEGSDWHLVDATASGPTVRHLARRAWEAVGRLRSLEAFCRRMHPETAGRRLTDEELLEADRACRWLSPLLALCVSRRGLADTPVPDGLTVQWVEEAPNQALPPALP